MQLSRNYVLAAVALWAVSLPLHAEEKPKAVLEQAIQAHGGNKNLARTLTGRLTAELKGTVSSDVEFTFQDEETFQLPRRYKRVLQGQFNGKPFRMTYAIEEGVGWIQQNDEDPREYRGQKLPLEKYWNAILAQLPELLRDDSILSAGG
ncbi:MAG: hypothetical protein JO112_16180, partial [Planctomycetes bacterium]|nr:hypothetical protein [Planctomycetota bacterium]